MPTKTSTKPQTPRAPKPSTQKIESRCAKPEPQFSGTQAVLADMFGELLTTGGAPEDVENAVYAGLCHHARKIFGPLTKDFRKLEKDVTEWADKHLQGWLDNLAVARAQRPQLPEDARPEPKTVSDRIREAARQTVEEYLREFAAQGSPEDMRLMLAVMEIWESSHASWMQELYRESPLAEAFAYALGANETYVKVPRRIVDHVESYVASLAGIAGQQLPSVPKVM
jgi:hypothetical protein